MIMRFKDLKYVPIDDRVLVQPGPVKYVMATLPVPDEEVNKKLPKDAIKEVRIEKQKVRTAFRIGQILAMSVNANTDRPFEVGDWVAYQERNAIKFDLLAKKDDDPKCPVMLRRYEIVGLVNNINNNQDE